jgi:hypothetical protein
MNSFSLKLTASLLTLLVSVFNAACPSQAHQVQTESETQMVANSPEPIVQQAKKPQSNLTDTQSSSIRKIDFRNFTYKEIQANGRPAKLVDGKLEFETRYCGTELTLGDVDYVDLTGDDEEEAIFSVSDFTACGSSSISYYFYVYALKNNRLKKLWYFKTGGRAYGGLKDFQLDGKDIVFELYGNAKIEGTRAKITDESVAVAACCPIHYTRFRLTWNGREFEQKSAEVFPYEKRSID